jgi:chemotaxis protein MotA
MRQATAPTTPASARPRYARAPLLGAGFGLFLVLSPMLLGARGFLILFSLGGLMIVVGGVVAVAFMSFRADDVRKALAAVVGMLQEPGPAQDRLIEDMARIAKWAGLVKDRGTMNVASAIPRSEIEDPFIKYGLNMVLSDYGADDIRAMMERAAEAEYERDSTPVDILHAMASHAPAFGMVGTLVGMVALLANLSGDVSGVAPSLAVAFLSTLHGVLSARMIYMPAAARLGQDVEERRFRRHLIVEGMAMIAAKMPPMRIQDRLNSFLRPEAHDYFDCFETAPVRPSARPMRSAA